jgi:hypothetical protein
VRFVKRFDGMSRRELEHLAGDALDQLAKLNQSTGLPGLGWDCKSCGAFNGDQKEHLKACRCCDAPRPSSPPG